MTSKAPTLIWAEGFSPSSSRRDAPEAGTTDSELQNDIDSIQTLIDSTLYKLTNLH